MVPCAANDDDVHDRVQMEAAEHAVETAEAAEHEYLEHLGAYIEELRRREYVAHIIAQEQADNENTKFIE